LLQIIALFLTINNHSFHRSKFISSANSISGNFYTKKNNISSYLDLRSENNSLIEENQLLKNKISLLEQQIDQVDSQTKIDSIASQQYKYVDGKIIKNEFHKPYNFLTINRGKRHGVTSEMAVVNHKGIIGVTDFSSENYSRVRSILNRDSKINAKLKNTTYFGSLSWDGKDLNTVQLADIPRQATINVGDTIVTGGNSTIFPKGIPIGIVEEDSKAMIQVKLFNEMNRLENIYTIINFDKQEIKDLENANNE